MLDSVVEARRARPVLPRLARRPRRGRCARCAAGAAPGRADPVADLAALVDRIAARGPLRGRVVGRARPARAQPAHARGPVHDPARGRLRSRAARRLPGRGARGPRPATPTPLLRLRRRAFAVDAEPPPARLLSSGVYAATTCEEVPMPWARSDAAGPGRAAPPGRGARREIPDSAFEPFDRATALGSDTLDLCERWPHAPAAPGSAPGRCPTCRCCCSRARTICARRRERARGRPSCSRARSLVVAPATGHSALGSDFSGCAERAFARFFQLRAGAGRAARACGASSCPSPPPPAPARRRAAAARHVRHPRAHARGGAAHAARRGARTRSPS